MYDRPMSILQHLRESVKQGPERCAPSTWSGGMPLESRGAAVSDVVRESERATSGDMAPFLWSGRRLSASPSAMSIGQVGQDVKCR